MTNGPTTELRVQEIISILGVFLSLLNFDKSQRLLIKKQNKTCKTAESLNT